MMYLNVNDVFSNVHFQNVEVGYEAGRMGSLVGELERLGYFGDGFMDSVDRYTELGRLRVRSCFWNHNDTERYVLELYDFDRLPLHAVLIKVVHQNGVDTYVDLMSLSGYSDRLGDREVAEMVADYLIEELM